MEKNFELLASEIEKFSKDRNWDQFHNPTNLILALMSEVGELAELVQWKNARDVIQYAQSLQGKQRLSEELADIAIYLIRLTQKCEIDFLEMIQQKLKINEAKYPINKSRGNSKKYTEL